MILSETDSNVVILFLSTDSFLVLLGKDEPASMAERSEVQSCPRADDCSSITVSWETGIESWSGQ